MEIERKWLIRKEKIPFDISSCEKLHIDQAYVSFSPTIRVRNIDHGKKHILTVKTAVTVSDPELSRNEYETEITEEEYRELMKIARGQTVSKTRHIKKAENGLKYEIDVFEGRFSGLAYLEIEFPDESTASAFPDPDWVECDVTYRPEYKNASLAKNGMPVSETGKENPNG